MLLAILAVAALAWWLHREGLLLPNLIRLGGTAAAGLLAVRFLTSGRILMAALAAAIAFGWWVWNSNGSSGNRRLTSAARLLGVPEDAPAEVIWQAWRQKMASAHPDAGGSDDQAQALTAARDLLISAAEKRRDSRD
ncbi:hypothetical protein CHU93_08570 [Sandarakinorhabdus cyanobacteriorum]|uniref:J domain-containing protein n=1 Tax=Sandarakinorhabdus cyanobacteriorum TaxID=1981098 RepID=A0A255YJT6_9SPHN|nr:hypothetical protein [Sandarakinorhabdus cyanobacteriorum]OYQ28740.1 hypothetical protein CHU93_08570 [Sandarakinorhabdus cyanobacteriorum]